MDQPPITFDPTRLNESEWVADTAWAISHPVWTHHSGTRFTAQHHSAEYDGAHSRVVALLGPNGEECVLKIMRSKYHPHRFPIEVRTQCLAATHGLAPAVLDYGWMADGGCSTLYILMERFGTSLTATQPRYITRAFKRTLHTLFNDIWNLGIVPLDVSLDNILWDGHSMKLIDFDPGEEHELLSFDPAKETLPSIEVFGHG